MTVRLRSTLASLPAYVPGRNVPGAIKLASNETAYPPLPYVRQRIDEAAAQINRYPDNFSVELTQALADRFGVTPDRVVVGCGSVSLCQQLALAAAGPGDEVLFGWRSFEAYPIVTAITGASAVPVPLVDDVHELDAMAAAITEKTRLVFVCNPNNPTGTVVAGEPLLRFLDAVPGDVLVVLDEAYREFVTDDSVIDGMTLLQRYPNVIVLRTFSKAYGLAGLRVGYGVAGDPGITNALRQTQAPFAVTQLGQTAALASLEPEAEKQLMQRVDEITAERSRVAAALVAAGFHVPTSQANFVWLGNRAATDGGQSGGHRGAAVVATDFGQTCEDNGVIVRVFADSGVRITIGSAAENDRFLDAARAYLAG